MRKNYSILNKATGLALAATMMLGFTSCEDILGHWEKPTPATVTPSESETPEPAAPTVTDLSMVDCAGNARTSMSTANCYMVHTAGDYKLPLVYGNAIKDGAPNNAAWTGVSGQLETFTNHANQPITDPWIKNNKDESDNDIVVSSAELLWQDAEGLITAVGIIKGDYLTLTVGKNASEQEGNALIAAKDAGGKIVWSWHIWVTKETFADATLTTVATGSHDYKVTPVNLGWVPTDGKQGYNTYYQWGRKDAFIPGTWNSTTNHTVYDINGNTVATPLTSTQNTTATIADNIQNPTTHYHNTSTNGPCTTTYYNMWDAQQTGTGNITTATKKTVYDPCPAGFCVPTGNLYYYIKNGGVSFGWDDTNKGRNLTSVTPNVFFPASGNRSRDTGNLDSSGWGFYWSASPADDNRLKFNSSNLDWSNSHRANGFSIRAVAEE